MAFEVSDGGVLSVGEVTLALNPEDRFGGRSANIPLFDFDASGEPPDFVVHLSAGMRIGGFDENRFPRLRAGYFDLPRRSELRKYGHDQNCQAGGARSVGRAMRQRARGEYDQAHDQKREQNGVLARNGPNFWEGVRALPEFGRRIIGGGLPRHKAGSRLESPA